MIWRPVSGAWWCLFARSDSRQTRLCRRGARARPHEGERPRARAPERRIIASPGGTRPHRACYRPRLLPATATQIHARGGRALDPPPSSRRPPPRRRGLPAMRAPRRRAPPRAAAARAAALPLLLLLALALAGAGAGAARPCAAAAHGAAVPPVPPRTTAAGALDAHAVPHVPPAALRPPPCRRLAQAPPRGAAPDEPEDDALVPWDPVVGLPPDVWAASVPRCWCACARAKRRPAGTRGCPGWAGLRACPPARAPGGCTRPAPRERAPSPTPVLAPCRAQVCAAGGAPERGGAGDLRLPGARGGLAAQA